jgi:hypothetical protein
MRSKVPYRCVATTAAGFVQQLAVSYIGHGYWFYVTGEIPSRKDPAATDRKLIDHYGIGISKWARARRKRAGLANLHYLRHDRFFVLLASKGEHRFFEEEKGFKDVRRDSISFDGYSIGYKLDTRGVWHPSVRIHPKIYSDLKAYFSERATKHSPQSIMEELFHLPFEPYAPIRVQLLCLYRTINRLRSAAGLETVPRSAVRLRRQPATVFGRGPT